MLPLSILHGNKSTICPHTQKIDLEIQISECGLEGIVPEQTREKHVCTGEQWFLVPSLLSLLTVDPQRHLF